jgi:hypothetical protein
MTANSTNKDLENENDNHEQLFEKVLNDIAQKTEKERNLFSQTHQMSPEIHSEYDRETKPIQSFEKNPEVVYTPYQPTPMELLKESFKWSSIVSLLVFIFMQPQIINKFVQYFPNKFISETGQLNLWGTLIVSILAGFLYFILYQWVF